MKPIAFLLAPVCTAGVLASSTQVQAANPDHVQRLQTSHQCPQCDLSNADLSNQNLYGANLVNANLSGANLSGSNLGAANLNDANLTGAKLNNVYLQAASLENTNLRQADLSGAYLRDAKLADAQLTGANLQNSNLSRTNLSGLDLSGVNLSGANLTNAMLSGVRPSGAGSGMDGLAGFVFSFQSKFLCEAPLDDATIEGARRGGFELAFANLTGANLEAANLKGALLPKANLSGANLKNANLTDACLRGSNFKNAILDGADLSNVRMDGVVLENASLKDVKNADLQGSFPNQEAVTLAPAQSEARQYVASMNRAQQAHYLEFERFGTKLDDLGLGIKSETQSYLYRVFAYPDRQRAVMLAGIPKKSGLKSYLGFVNIGRNSNNETVTFAILCESQEAKPLLPKLPAVSTLPKTGAMRCPAGFSRV